MAKRPDWEKKSWTALNINEFILLDILHYIVLHHITLCLQGGYGYGGPGYNNGYGGYGYGGPILRQRLRLWWLRQEVVEGGAECLCFMCAGTDV